MLADLPRDIDYVGFDESETYVRAAQARFGHRATFHCFRADRRTLDSLGPASFDLVVAHGVVHHLDDAEAREFFALARGALKPDGRLVTADGCYVDGQSRVARFILAHDRGAHVRTAQAYQRLAREQFSSITTNIRDDVTRVPYTMIYLTCRP
jgi:SAM-dependent methyltransferase